MIEGSLTVLPVQLNNTERCCFNFVESGYMIRMLKVDPCGEMKVIRNTFDWGVISAIVRGRSMMVPITPHIAAFVLPNKQGPENGTLITPMQSLPRRLPVFNTFVVVAFDKQEAVSLSDDDFIKFNLLYRGKDGLVQKGGFTTGHMRRMQLVP